MNKAYLLAFSNDFGTTESVKEYLNAIPSVLKWRYDMSNAFYLISSDSATELTNKLRQKRTEGFFIITEIPQNSNGWVTPGSWHLIQTHEYLRKA